MRRRLKAVRQAALQVQAAERAQALQVQALRLVQALRRV
jgi:hypothetical protein